MWGFIISYAAAHLILPNGQCSGVATNMTVAEYEDKDEFSKLNVKHNITFIFQYISVHKLN